MNILQFILFIVYLLEAVNGLKCGSQITISMESPEKPFRTAKKDFKRAFPNVKHQFYVWAAQSKGGILCRVGKEDCFMHKDLICKVCENFNNDHYRHWFKWANETEDHDLKIGACLCKDEGQFNKRTKTCTPTTSPKVKVDQGQATNGDQPVDLNNERTVSSPKEKPKVLQHEQPEVDPMNEKEGLNKEQAIISDVEPEVDSDNGEWSFWSKVKQFGKDFVSFMNEEPKNGTETNITLPSLPYEGQTISLEVSEEVNRKNESETNVVSKDDLEKGQVKSNLTAEFNNTSAAQRQQQLGALNWLEISGITVGVLFAVGLIIIGVVIINKRRSSPQFRGQCRYQDLDAFVTTA